MKSAKEFRIVKYGVRDSFYVAFLCSLLSCSPMQSAKSIFEKSSNDASGPNTPNVTRSFVVQTTATTIKSKISSQCITALPSESPQLQQYPCGSQAGQTFQITPVDGTYYMAEDTTSGECLAMAQAPFVTPLTLRTCNSTDSSQLLIFDPDSYGGYQIQTAFRSSGDYQACAEVNGGKSAAGTMINENICYAGTATSFSLSLPAMMSSGQALMADSFVDSIGVNTHFVDQGGSIYGAEISMVQGALNASGIRHIRDGGPASGDAAWMSSYLSLYTQVESNYQSATGQRLGWDLIAGAYDNGSSSGTACDDLLKISIPYVLNYFNVADIDSIEAWNEDDIGYTYNTPGCASSTAQAMPQDVAFQEALYPSVKGNSATAHIPVVGLSFGGGGASYVPNMSAYMDFANQHSYPAGKHPSQNIASNLSQLATINGGRSSYATETGYYTEPDSTQGVSELAHGKYMSRLFLEYFNFGVVRTYLYEFMDGVANQAQCSGSSQNCYGLVRGDGSAKPGYTAVQNEISILKDPGGTFSPGSLVYSLTGGSSLVHHTLLTKRNGSFYLILWQEVDSYNNAANTDITNATVSMQLSFSTPMSQVSLYNPLISATPSSTQNNVQSLQLNVPDSALIVEIVPPSNQSSPTTPLELVSVNSEMCADVLGGGQVAGTLIKQNTCNASSEQLWKFVAMGNGYYEVQPQNAPTWCMSIASVSKSDGAVAQQWGCSASATNELWQLVPMGGHYQLVSENSAMCLDVTGVSQVAGAQLQQWACGGASQLNQLWDLTVPPSTPPVVPSTPVELVSVNSRMCADVSGGGQVAGTLIKQNPCTGSNEQLWKFAATGNGYYEVQPQNAPTWCMSIASVSKSAGAVAQQWGCSASATNELWKLVPMGGHYQLVSENSAMCLDVTGVSTTAGAQLQQWGCGGASQTNQLWDLVVLPT